MTLYYCGKGKGSHHRRKAVYLWTLSVHALTPPPMTLWTTLG